MAASTISRIAVLAALIAIPALAAAAPNTAPRKTLQAFASDRELEEVFRKWREQQPRLERRAMQDSAQGPVAAAAPAAAEASAKPAGSIALRAFAGADSVTNVQHAGVDEGGIVKVHGDHLVILRRGRLFTVNIRGRELKPVTAVNAYGPGVDARGAWYDEMLISGNTIIVIGYSYARGGTEIGLFDITSGGDLKYRATYHLRSNDYYSSRNYASRLIGTKLVFYTPLMMNPWAPNPFDALPAFRRWQPGSVPSEFKRIAPAHRIYRTDEDIDPRYGVALHTVAMCDLAKAEIECTSTAVMGPPGRVFYVSDQSVFVWTSAWRTAGMPAAGGSGVFRIPLDGSAPSALKTMGSPIDQFSFLESGDGHLNVLLRADGAGEGMFGAERGGLQLALMRVALSSFSDGKDSAPRSAYRQLPTPNGYALQSRYVGPWLVFGAGTGWRRPPANTSSHVYAIRYAGEAPAHELPIVHGVDRIEALGTNAVVIGTDGKDLHFTSLRLGARAETADRYTRANAAQGETRSHGFYYRPQSEDEGLVGLPIIGGGQGASGQLRRTSASLLYLRNRGLKLSELGTLESKSDERSTNDACVASCVDWYGNSRPLFLRNRVFALLGYEIVEGTFSNGRIAESQRMSFAPHWLQWK